VYKNPRLFEIKKIHRLKAGAITKLFINRSVTYLSLKIAAKEYITHYDTLHGNDILVFIG